MMLPHPDEIDAELICENGLVDQVANDLRVREPFSVVTNGDVAECVEAEL